MKHSGSTTAAKEDAFLVGSYDHVPRAYGAISRAQLPKALEQPPLLQVLRNGSGKMPSDLKPKTKPSCAVTKL